MNQTSASQPAISHKSFFKTALISLLAITLLVTLLLNTFLMANHIRDSISRTKQFEHNLLTQTNYAIRQMSENANRLSQTLLGNKDVISFLNMKNHDPVVSVMAARYLMNQLLLLPNVDSIYLYNARLDLFYSSKTGEQRTSGSFADQEIVSLVKWGCAENSPNPLGSSHPLRRYPVPTSDNTGYNPDTLSYILYDTAAPSKNQTTCNAIVINTYSRILTDSIHAINAFPDEMDISYVVMDTSGHTLSYVLNPELAQQPGLFDGLFQDVTDEVPDGFIRLNGKKYLEVCTTRNEYGWYIIALIPAVQIMEPILDTAIFSAAIAIAVFLFGSGICLLLARRLNSPIQTITSLMRGETVDAASSILQTTEEFRYILTVYDSMKAQNRQLDKIERETAYSLRQDFLNSLVTGSSTKPQKQIREFLEHQGLLWILEHPVAMAVLKIDEYKSFLTNNDMKEHWVLRFAVANISEELATEQFTSCVFSDNHDKFILLADCRGIDDYAAYQEKLEKLLNNIRQNVSSCMRLSLSASYSTIIKDPKQLPSIYSNLKEALLLKMKFGHGSIITPYMADELETDPFQIPPQELSQMISAIVNGAGEEAVTIYRRIASSLGSFSYSEIISVTIHVFYSIYSSIQPQYPALNESLTTTLQQSLEHLHEAEILDDITNLTEHFINDVCAQIHIRLETLGNENSITFRICRIIEKEYSSPAICLSSIAGDIGLSSSYVGHVFKACTGKSVSQYILDYRMKQLTYYLDHTSLSLTDILTKVGMEKSNYFYTQFKKYFGMTLGEYRERNISR